MNCIEKRRDFRRIFSGLRLLGNKAGKLFKKLGENSEENSGENPGRKFEKFGELSFLQLFGPNVFANRHANRPFFGLVCLGGLQFWKQPPHQNNPLQSSDTLVPKGLGCIKNTTTY